MDEQARRHRGAGLMVLDAVEHLLEEGDEAGGVVDEDEGVHGALALGERGAGADDGIHGSPFGRDAEDLSLRAGEESCCPRTRPPDSAPHSPPTDRAVVPLTCVDAMHVVVAPLRGAHCPCKTFPFPEQ